MVTVDPLALFTVATGVALGNYSVFYLVFERSFVTRYKAYREKFDTMIFDEVTKFLTNLGEKAEGKNAEKNLVQEIIESGRRFSALKQTTDRYGELRDWARASLIIFLISAIISLLTFDYSGPLATATLGALNYTDISLFLLFVGSCTTAYYMIGFWALSSQITRVELGEPIAEVIRKELEG